MHELGIALRIVETVRERAAGAPVRVVRVDVGQLVAVLPDALSFCFGLACEGTEAEGARLEIREVPGRARCRACEATFAVDRPYGRCACGGVALDLVAGEELWVRDMEVG